MPSFDEITDLIVKANVPVLIPDTCSVLDILREWYRESGANARQTVYTAEILTAAQETPPRCLIVTPSVMQTEIGHNLAEEARKMEKVIHDWEALTSSLSAVSNLASLPFAHTAVNKIGISAFLQNAITTILSVGVAMPTEDALHRRAGLRVIGKVAPASAGKQEFKDCLLFEESLEITRSLRSGGFQKPVVFYTSNKSDFKEKDGRFRAEIEADAAENRLLLANSWEHSKHLLGL